MMPAPISPTSTGAARLCGRLVGTALLTQIRATRLLARLRDHRGAALPHRACGAGPGRGLCCACHRLFQFDHVPDDLHDHARTVGRVAELDLGPALPRDLRRRACCRWRSARSPTASGSAHPSSFRSRAYAFIAFFALAARGATDRQIAARAAGERLADPVAGDESNDLRVPVACRVHLHRHQFDLQRSSASALPTRGSSGTTSSTEPRSTRASGSMTPAATSRAGSMANCNIIRPARTCVSRTGS